MKIQKHTVISILFFISYWSLFAQTIESKIVDKKTNQPIPYATIQLSESDGIITNEEGRFSVTIQEKNTPIDSIFISSMGYERVGIAVQNTIDTIIYINPKAVALKSVFVTNKNLSVDEIIDNVEDGIRKNYDFDLTNKKLFFRESYTNFINKLDIEFKKSTIVELDKKLIDSIVRIIPKKSEFYTEVLGNFYGNLEKQKLNISKGARLYDKDNEGSVEALYKKIETILKENIKPDSYLKIKSGIFSQKVQVDSILKANQDAADIKNELGESKENFFYTSRKTNLTNLFADLFFQEDTKLNIIRKSGRYTFEKVDFTTIDDSGVYIINFSPNRWADFKGTLYVNTEDFSVMRIDYQNVKPLKKYNLLGISYEETLYSGKTFFSKGINGKYSPRFIEKITGNKFGVDRPLKVIEKNKNIKGKRKQNELSLELDIFNTNRNKYEVIVFDTQSISEKGYTSAKENKNIEAAYLSRYDPNFWKGYTIIEPNAAIKEFTIEEEE
ncbi:hypothetical protein GCM10022393_07430 [Aquimarina addita]|uniref:Carboxypeptidase-like regulatory domain-containing protein n=1 Tax=Aquimarina addita TaxID=870485 RepID=A0ABP7XBD4_9FLAO